jgi:hypothetical protein
LRLKCLHRVWSVDWEERLPSRSLVVAAVSAA